MRCLLLACVLVAACYPVLGLKQAVARINARGIVGTITFSAVNDTCTRIEVDLDNLQGEQGWHVHTLPIDQTVSPDVQCLSIWAGPHYDPTDVGDDPMYDTLCTTATPEGCEYGDLAGRFGLLPANGELDVMDCTGHIRLQGFYSIVGRSVVIHEAGTGENFECGTILSQEEIDGANVVILQSVFVSPIGGRMYFKQVEGLPDVQIWGKLYYVNDTDTTLYHNWHIHDSLPDEDYRVGVCGPAGPHFDPLNADASAPDYSERCNVTMPTGCEIGDLTRKLGTINVHATPGDYSNNSFFFTDTYLNLTGTYEVIDLSVVVHVPNRGAARLGCAPLVEAENITVFGYPGKSGEAPLATISQYSPFQNTNIKIGILPSEGESSDLTIVAAAFSPNGACPLDGSSTFDSTYSPREPVPDVMTPDGFDLGDISGAYSDYVVSNGPISAFDLPTYGAIVTVSGRTLRFTDGEVRKCQALVPLLDFQNIVFARASFSGGAIGGNIFFIQERGNDVVTGSTFITVDIYYNDNDMEMTSTHNWHIHQYPADLEEGEECVDVIGGHYNPFDVSLLTEVSDPVAMFSDYSQDCNGNYQLRCESGDLSGKHGQLSIAPGNSLDRPSYSYVDNNLELGGTYSVVGRSVGLHLPTAEGGDLFDCATVEQFFESGISITTTIPVADFTTRVEFAAQMAEEAGIDGLTANDILILSQHVTEDDQTVAVTYRVLASTQMEADCYAAMISGGDLSVCETDDAPIPLLAPFLLLSSLLLSILLQ